MNTQILSAGQWELLEQRKDQGRRTLIRQVADMMIRLVQSKSCNDDVLKIVHCMAGLFEQEYLNREDVPILLERGTIEWAAKAVLMRRAQELRSAMEREMGGWSYLVWSTVRPRETAAQAQAVFEFSKIALSLE